MSIDDLFASLDTDDVNSNAAPLVSPYSEDDPLDSDALYSGLLLVQGEGEDGKGWGTDVW